MNFLYILEINPFLVASFAHIFSHSLGCLFILFMVSFAVQTLFLLFFFKLIIYLFIFGCVGSSLLRMGFLILVAVSGGYSSLPCAGLSLRWPLSSRSTGSRRAGSRAQAQ